MLPLNESDFLDFVYNYFKAEYAPIRSFWSTATADPRQPQRWINMVSLLSHQVEMTGPDMNLGPRTPTTQRAPCKRTSSEGPRVA